MFIRKSKLFHPVMVSTALRIVAMVVGVGGSIVIARLGGAELKGISAAYAATVSVAFMFMNLDLAQQALRRFRESSANPRDVHGSSPQLIVGSLLLRAWSVYLVVGTIALVFLLLIDSPAFWILAGAAVFTVMTQAGVAATGLKGASMGSLGAIVQQSSLIVAVICFWHFSELTEWSIKVCLVVSYASPLLLYVPQVFSAGLRGSGESWRSVGRLVWRGLPWQLGRFFQILIQKLDLLTVTVVLGAAVAGIYSVGLSTAMLCTLIPAQISSHILYKAATSSSTPLRVRRHLGMAFLLGLIPALVLAVIGAWLIELMYGAEFRDSYTVMAACLPGAIGYGMLQVQTNIIRMVSHWRGFVLVGVLGAACMVIGLLVLMPRFGAVGAGIAFSITALVSVGLNSAIFRSSFSELQKKAD